LIFFGFYSSRIASTEIYYGC